MFSILDMNLLSDRIKQIQDENPDLEQVGLVKISGASKSVVNQWIDGKIKSMRLDFALNIERELGYSHIWLVLGEGDPKQKILPVSADEAELITDYRAANPTIKAAIISTSKILGSNKESEQRPQSGTFLQIQKK